MLGAVAWPTCDKNLCGAAGGVNGPHQHVVRDGAHLFKSRPPLLCKLFNMVDSAAAGGAAAPPRAIPWGVSDLGWVTEYSVKYTTPYVYIQCVPL